MSITEGADAPDPAGRERGARGVETLSAGQRHCRDAAAAD
jgi:hypothetical protein